MVENGWMDGSQASTSSATVDFIAMSGVCGCSDTLGSGRGCIARCGCGSRVEVVVAEGDMADRV